MGNSKHIFIQIDTDSIILLEKEIRKLQKKGNQKEINSLIREHTLIYDQGSMSLGNPIKNFAIDVEQNQEVHFAILPVQMYSHHKLYFNGFTCIKKIGIHFPKLETKHCLSFRITVDSHAKSGDSTEFCLHAVLEYEGHEPIFLAIDPVIRIIQN